ncbi:MAG: hypothetical protein ACT4PT_03225 [Methanobacteriota archaeon]
MFCPTHKMLMRRMEGVLLCPVPGCKTAERPKESEVKISAIQTGERRIDKGVLIEDPEKFQRQLLPTDENVVCGKCGTKGPYYRTRQTRKADEPTTIFYTCSNASCKNSWKR